MVGVVGMTRDLRHGGALDDMRRRFPSAPDPWIDLSTGINPWSLPIGVDLVPAFQTLPTSQSYRDCRAALAQYLDIEAENILLAPGSELLIRLLPTVLNPRKVAILAPTYGDHAEVWKQAGCDVLEVDQPLYYCDQVDVIVLCNPNNPDGRRFDPERLEHTRNRLAARSGWLIVDEAYADLDPTLSCARFGGRPGLIILRSMGKFFGLPGLRLGAAIAPKSLQNDLLMRMGQWRVSGPALVAGCEAYSNSDWQVATRARLAAARRTLDPILMSAGLFVIGGTDLFRYVEVEAAHKAWNSLALSGIYVRRFDWSDRHLRIGLPAGLTAETRLAEALSPLA